MLLAQLKSATAALHDRVEAAMPSLDAMATPAGYAAALRALHAFHAAWEPALWATPGVDEAGLGAARKLPLLARDLRALGLAPLPHRPPAPAPASAAEALGGLYVLEGATLGGQVIQRRVAGPLGVTPARGGAYFHGYGRDTGARWTAFRDALARAGEAPGAPPRMVAGAAACFAALESWLRTPGVVPLAPAEAAA